MHVIAPDPPSVLVTLPGLQLMQLDRPEDGWYKPGEQLLHAVNPELPEYVPGKQAAQAIVDEDENLPASQAVQDVAPDPPSVLVTLPELQLSQLACPDDGW